MKIKLFGLLTELIGHDGIEVDDIKDTDALFEWLHKNYPSLQQKKILISVNKQLIHSNMLINDQCEIAILPPFSGG